MDDVVVAVKRKFKGKKINFRSYMRCHGFLNRQCHIIIVDPEKLSLVEDMEEWTTTRFSYDGNNKMFFESEEDAVMFKLRYGIQGKS